ncbi:MAG: ABC transporter permease [Cyclobacteriaceae bacterium]
MFYYNLQIALRYLLKNKNFFLLQISILVIGLCSIALVAFYHTFENSYDKHITDHESIFRVVTKYSNDYGEIPSAMVSPKLLEAFRNEYDIKTTAIYYWPYSDILVANKDSKYYESKFFRTDSTFLDVFNLPLLEGSSTNALNNPYSILISKRTANKYFASESALGNMLKVNDGTEYTVTGVFADIPVNTHFDFDLIAFSGKEFPGDWSENKIWLYAKNGPGSEMSNLKNDMDRLVNKYYPESIKKSIILDIQRLEDIHFYSNLDQEFKNKGALVKLKLFFISGILISLIACINYINLSTANFASRKKGVGIRKSFGATMKNLFVQYLVETFVVVFISSVFSLLILTLLSPILPEYLKLTNQSMLSVFLWFLAASFSIGIIAGFYPAISMARSNILNALEGESANNKNTFSLRNILVTVQIVVSVTFILMIVQVKAQMDYVLKNDSIVSKNNVIVLNVPSTVAKSWNWNVEAFKNELKQISGIKSVAPITIPWEKGKIEKRKIRFNTSSTVMETPVNVIWVSDSDYQQLYGLDFTEGNGDIKQINAEDSRPKFEYVINAEAARLFENEDAYGQKIELMLAPDEWYEGDIKGIVKNFHYQSMHQKIAPLVFISGMGFSNIGIKYTGNIAPVTEIEETWKMFSDWPLSYFHMDESYSKLYDSERESHQLLTWLTITAIFLSVTGIVGLVLYNLSRSKKNVAIRKVLGAGIPEILLYLNKDYLKLTALASVISIPLVFILYRFWSENFVYKVNLDLKTIFIVLLIILSAVLLITVSTSIKTARINPSKHLNEE